MLTLVIKSLIEIEGVITLTATVIKPFHFSPDPPGPPSAHEHEAVSRFELNLSEYNTLNLGIARLSQWEGG